MAPLIAVVLLGLGGVALYSKATTPNTYKAPQHLLRISMSFDSESQGLYAIKILEGHGQIVQMHNWDGQNLTVDYRPSAERPRQWELALEGVGTLNSIQDLDNIWRDAPVEIELFKVQE